MKTRALIIAVLLLATIPLSSQKDVSVAIQANSTLKAIEAITLTASQAHMRYLASDELAGRRTGSEGNNAAAAYIRSEALRLGLRPVPGLDDLLQPLEYLRTSLVPDGTGVTLKDSLGNLFSTADLMPLMHPGDNLTIDAEVVFAGYGHLNSKEKYNDLTGVTLKDRVVIVMTRSPQLPESGRPGDDQEIVEMDEIRKIPMILLQQAKAILFVADPALGTDISSDLLSMGSPYELKPLFRKQMFSFSFNAFAITGETADRMLANSGLTLKKLQDSIASSLRPASFVIPNLRVQIDVEVTTDTVISNNVIGYREGSDPLLKDEAVVYIAHYDHVGTDAAGNIYNGANDNASGTVGLLNIAAAYQALERQPARSALFLWATGEEEGLHGSTYYTENPPFPLEKTVAAINFDMIGRSRLDTDVGQSLSGKIDITGPDTIRVIHGTDSPQLYSLAADACLESDIYPLDDGKGDHFSGSDHFPFYRKEIPVLFFFTGLHKDYHKPSDEYRLLDFDKLVKVFCVGFFIGYRVASDPEFKGLEREE